jgi:hypothetical protein
MPNQYSEKENEALVLLIESLFENTETSIEFLVDGLNFEEDDIEILDDLALPQKIHDEIYNEDMDMETIREALEYIEVEGFDKESLNIDEE